MDKWRSYGKVGKVVTLDTRGPQFESPQSAKSWFVFVSCITVKKRKKGNDDPMIERQMAANIASRFFKQQRVATFYCLVRWSHLPSKEAEVGRSKWPRFEPLSTLNQSVLIDATAFQNKPKTFSSKKNFLTKMQKFHIISLLSLSGAVENAKSRLHFAVQDTTE